MSTYTFDPIGIVHSPFKEKFGIPRQSGLVPEARGYLQLYAPYNRPEAVSGLEGYSHIWVQFVFHQTLRVQWKPTVRPPRLGGNRRVGVFASRSPFRPNPIGLSVARLDAVEIKGDRVGLLISGIDLLDGTPVLDIKPYVGYADSLRNTRSGFAPEPPALDFTVYFSTAAESQLQRRDGASELRRFIVRLLSLDPRPAYQGGAAESTDRVYGMRLYDFDLRWRVDGSRVEVLALERLTE